jgi:uncharacterized SAM-binding protein YcdF (DUF218 family)
MFFFLSKTLWFLADPGNLFLLLITGGLLLWWLSFKRIAGVCVGLALCIGVIATLTPTGTWAVSVLQNRFSQPIEMPSKVDGIIVLGGVVSPDLTDKFGQLVIGAAVERVTESAALAKRYPDARMIYTGGSGSVLHPDQREADYILSLYEQLGISADRLELERDARNTHENALYAFRMAQPSLDETWLLVTSAFHMPRSVGSFRMVGWNVIPFPVDYSIAPDAIFTPSFNFRFGLNNLSAAMHEWIGLFAYWLSGKSNAAFPGPYEVTPS